MLNPSLPAFIKKLLDRRPALYPGEEWDDILDIQIRKWTVPVQSDSPELEDYAKACKSGLYLFNESLDASHTIAQELEHIQTGSWWHAIMHRMEGDYSNSKYWFRTAGKHSIEAELLKEAKAWLNQADMSTIQSPRLGSLLSQLSELTEWSPALFVDAVQTQVQVAREAAGEAILQELQWIEMRLLLQYSYETACGGKLFENAN